MFDIVVACTTQGGIGYQGSIPWNIPDDLRHFAEVTRHGIVIMGRKTWDSLPYKPLKQRINIVVSTTTECSSTHVCDTLQSALNLCASAYPTNKVYVIGGQSMYQEALKHPECHQVFVTRIHSDVQCDTFFPFRELQETFHHVVAGFPKTENGFSYSFHTYQRR